MKLNVEDGQGEGRTLFGDWLAEPLLAFFAGGGETLAERDGDGEADAGAGLFWAAGWGDTDRDDALLKGCGLGDGLKGDKHCSLKVRQVCEKQKKCRLETKERPG